MMPGWQSIDPWAWNHYFLLLLQRNKVTVRCTSTLGVTCQEQLAQTLNVCLLSTSLFSLMRLLEGLRRPLLLPPFVRPYWMDMKRPWIRQRTKRKQGFYLWENNTRYEPIAKTQKFFILKEIKIADLFIFVVEYFSHATVKRHRTMNLCVPAHSKFFLRPSVRHVGKKKCMIMRQISGALVWKGVYQYQFLSSKLFLSSVPTLFAASYTKQLSV